MDKRILIIHTSVIVQKGLQAILRDSFNADYILLNSASELEDYNGITDCSILVISADDFTLKKALSKLKAQGNKVIHAELTEKKAQGNQIGFYDDSSEIIRKIKEIIDSGNKKENSFSDLSEREKDVLQLVALGYQNKEIADKLFISIHTVISHRKNITEKLGIKSISGLTVYAILNKIIDTDNIDPSTLI